MINNPFKIVFLAMCCLLPAIAFSDTTAPVVTVDPLDSPTSGPVTIAGSAQDDIGVVKNKLLIRNRDTGDYWNGSTWVSRWVWFDVAGGADWSYEIDLPAARFYVVAFAWDSAGNKGITRLYFGVEPGDPTDPPDPTDTTPPIVTIDPLESPSAGLITISGSALDDSAVTKNKLLIRNRDTGDYWNGSIWVSGWVWFEVAGGADWSYEIDLPAANFDLVAFAWDSNNNKGITRSNFSVEVGNPTDTTPPSVTIDPQGSPTSGSITISGTAVDDSAIAQNKLLIRNRDTGAYWNGTAWVSRWSSFEFTGGENWSYELNLTAANYAVVAFASDSSNNESKARAYFTVEEGFAQVAGDVTALHRSGQTFLTWNEINARSGYHVYRSSRAITVGNITSAKKLTSRWGALGSDTSKNTQGGSNVPANLVIADLAPALADDQGLFVYTTQSGDSSSAYYAVVPVTGGVEDFSNLQTSGRVSESVATPRDVLTVSVNNGKGRIYTQYMDYTNWNPTFNGYVYNYSVVLPGNYNSAQSYPLLVEPHAYGEVYKFLPKTNYDWEVITLYPHDPGFVFGEAHSWWYGYSADHNYQTDNSPPDSGTIENFTEQRVMRSVDAVLANGFYNVDEQRIHAYGHSMGGSGTLAWGMRYPSLFSGIYASQPMTNYKTTQFAPEEFVMLWGSKSDNLPITNGGARNQDIRLYGEQGVQSVGVWDWMNHQKQLVERRGDDFAFLMTTHGKQDTVIEWQTQGKPLVRAMTNANVGFGAENRQNGHTWTGFLFEMRSLFGFGFEDNFPWKYPLDLSFPAVQNASGSGPVWPSNNGVDSYNQNIEWATSHTPFDLDIVDLPNKYEVTLRSSGSNQRADITPRRTQRFSVDAGDECAWTTTNRNNNNILSSGVVVADADSLVTVPAVYIVRNIGTRLVIDCS